MSTIYMIVKYIGDRQYINKIAYKDKDLALSIADNTKKDKRYSKVEVIDIDFRE